MNILKKILIGFVVIVNGLVILSFFLPDRTNSRIEKTIAATPEQIFPLIVGLKHWPEWSAWGREDIPGIEYKFEGPESGVGAIMHWDSPDTNGTLTIREVEVNRRMAYSITMENGNGAATGSFELEALADGQTRVVWQDSSEIKGPPVISTLMIPLLESMIDQGLERGLEGIADMAPARN